MDADPTAHPPDRRRWWAHRSLRTRLTAATVLVLAVGMTIAALVLVGYLHGTLVSSLDAVVSQQAQTVAATVHAGPMPLALPDSGDGVPVVQIMDTSHRVLAQSSGLDTKGRLFTFHGSDDPVFVTVPPLPAGDADDPGRYRVAAVTVNTPDHEHMTVYAALPLRPVTQSVTALTTALAVGVPVLVALLAALSWLLVGRALRPVEAIRRQAAAIPATDLHRRLMVPAARDELGRLTVTLNELLARIDASTARQRQFVADAAHELRSPIASLRAQLEVAALHPDAVPANERVDRLLADTRRLGVLVDDLLALARLDSVPRPVRETVDLDDILLAEIRRVREHGVPVDTTGVSAGRVEGDPGALTRVVRNLLDNATRHAATRVRVSLHTDRSLVVLTVADDGVGIPQADRSRVFERFVRLDDARARDDGGAGLGLAIVKEVIAAHAGTVRIDDSHPGAQFTVTLPEAE